MCKYIDYTLNINNIDKSNSLCWLSVLCNNNECAPTESIKMSPKVSLKNLLNENAFENRQKYANKLKYSRIKKLALPISFAILLAVPFAVFISKRNLQTEKYKYQG